jgi:tRNA CCA-adding enzyme
MMKHKEILKEVLKEISPCAEEVEFAKKRTAHFIERIKKGKNEKIILGGSLAKGTLIKKEEQDVDIFIIFKNEESTKNLEKILKRSKINANKIHGSRDYFQLREKNLLFEFMPIVKVEKNKQNKNVTDFSPLHVNYIKKNATNQILDEIKLAKSFCMAQGVYGAESYIQGFSGYAIELLICHYGSFLNFLKRIQKDEFIDSDKMFKNKKEAFREINESKLLSPLVLIDPTNKYRNVCAGLGKESLDKLKESAKEFLKKPSKKLFRIEEFNEQEFITKEKQKGLEVCSLELMTDRENRDIAGTKMKKFFKFIIKELEIKQQKVNSSEFIYSNGKTARAIISFNKKSIIEIKGPSKDMKSAVQKFKKTRKKIFFSKGFSYTNERFSLEDFFKSKEQTANDMEIRFRWKII